MKRANKKRGSAAVQARAAILLAGITAGVVANKGLDILGKQTFMQHTPAAGATGFAAMNLKKLGTNVAIAVAASGACMSTDNTSMQVAAASVASAAIGKAVEQAEGAMAGLGSVKRLSMYDDNFAGTYEPIRLRGQQEKPIKFA